MENTNQAISAILVYHPAPAPRLAYIARYVIEELWRLRVIFTHEETAFSCYEGPKICYHHLALPASQLWLIPHSLLQEQEVREQALATGLHQGVATICQVPPGGALPFDPFAASFYLLSRYEEYLPYSTDAHGRYPARLSWAHRAASLDRPIIWEWAEMLWQQLQINYPGLTRPARSYTFAPTYDIDLPWAFRHRGLRGLARAGIDLLQGQWPLTQARVRTWLGMAEDPFYTFSYLHKLHLTHGIRPQVFWLVAAKRSNFDVNPSTNTQAFQQLIQETAQWADVGLHPSYAAFASSSLLAQERECLQHITKLPITHSRQHFLRLRLPDTYRQLLAAGIRHDYTMGYAEVIGYRAGTSESFYWFDLEKNEVTALRVHPFVAMDVTLRKYLALSPDEAQQQLQEIRAYLLENKLTLCTLWHNSSFSEPHGWADWKEVFESMF